MADVYQRIWKSGPRRVRKTAWGYTLQLNGKQIRKFNTTWTREQAEEALAATLLEKDVPKVPPPAMHTFGEAVERYLEVKAASAKRSLDDDRRHLRRLRA